MFKTKQKDLKIGKFEFVTMTQILLHNVIKANYRAHNF